MSEDDLFLALKRTPFGIMFIMCLGVTISPGDDIISLNMDLLEANGWDVQAFQERLIIELRQGNIDLDVGVVNDPGWRRKVLSLNLI